MPRSQVHKAYERIRRIYDPNSIALYSLFSPEETEKIRQRGEEAYRTLLYDENRRGYGLRLHGIELSASVQPQPQHRQAGPHAARKDEATFAAAAPPVHAEPRAVPAAPPTPLVPAIAQPVPPDITEFTGAVLRMLREQRGLTLQNVADITKLSTRYLEWIENEYFAKLPVRPYLRGFLINYGQGREIKLRQCFLWIASRLGQSVSQTLKATAFEFIIQEQRQEFNRSQLFLHGLFRPQLERVEHTGMLELAQFGEKRMGHHSFSSTNSKNSDAWRAKVKDS